MAQAAAAQTVLPDDFKPDDLPVDFKPDAPAGVPDDFVPDQPGDAQDSFGKRAIMDPLFSGLQRTVKDVQSLKAVGRDSAPGVSSFSPGPAPQSPYEQGTILEDLGKGDWTHLVQRSLYAIGKSGGAMTGALAGAAAVQPAAAAARSLEQPVPE